MKNSFNTKIAILLFILSILLVVKWLPGDLIVAGGDVGIPVLNPQKVLYEQSYSWWDTHATGVSNQTTYTALPFYVLLTALEKFGANPAFNQKLLFIAILFGGSISIYFLALQFSFKRSYAAIASLFYIFNLITLSVWQRGVHNAMLMLLLGPLSLLILVKGIKEKKYSSIIWINIVSLLLSYVFGALGYVFSLWLLWIVYLIINLCTNWRDKTTRNFNLIYYLILIISWIGTNSWWLLHLIYSTSEIIGQFSQEELKSRGSDVLAGLKPYHQPQYILRGLSAFYHYGVKDWGNSYFNPLLILFSWVPTIIVFSTAVIKENYKSAYWKFLMALIIIILVFSKGVNAPLGLLNALLYDIFPLFTPLRNPYEKIGILLAIPFSLLFAQGLQQITNFLILKKMKYFKTLIILIGFICLTILVWPLWSGKILISEGRKYKVSIPNYYQQANTWLKEKVLAEDVRILHLPTAWGESIDYNWEYTGIEPSQYFFNGSSIGYEIGVMSVDSRIRDIIIALHNQNIKDFQSGIASLNIGWVVFHNEIVWRPRILESPERIKSFISSNSQLFEHQIDFGPLSIYKINNLHKPGHLYTTDKLIAVSGLKPQSSLNIWDKIINPSDSFVSELSNGNLNSLSKYISESIIYPKNISKYNPFDNMNRQDSFNSIATVNILPDSLFYPVVLFKERILDFLSQHDPVLSCFSLSGKRLKEAALMSRQNKHEDTKKSLERYTKQLKECSALNKNNVIGYMKVNHYKDLTLGQLIKQMSVLDNEFGNVSVVEEGKSAKITLTEYLADLGFTSMFKPLKEDNNKQKVLYRYDVPEEDYYTIKFNNQTQKFIKVLPTIVQIDEEAVELVPTVNGTNIEFPAVKLSKGKHEIQLNIEQNHNLINGQLESKFAKPDAGFIAKRDETTGQIVFATQEALNYKSLNFDPSDIQVGQEYELEFDIVSNGSIPPFLVITHDSDPYDASGNQIPAFQRQIELNKVGNTQAWQSIRMDYSPALNATNAKLSFIIFPSTAVEIKNVSFKEKFSAQLVLEKASKRLISGLNIVDMNWKKINPTLYELTISNQKLPFVLIFSETFHPLWELQDAEGKVVKLPHFSINGFANAWLAEKVVPQKIYVKFILQDIRNKGIYISLVSYILLIGLVVVLKYRRK